jgi:penicillin amidase
MIVSLSSAGVTAQGVYPGGQSENPASPWYADQIPLWWDGQYLPVPEPASAQSQPAQSQPAQSQPAQSQPAQPQPGAGTLTWTLTTAVDHG